jgi:magnesium-transporting ATPase (P-type)
MGFQYSSFRLFCLLLESKEGKKIRERKVVEIYIFSDQIEGQLIKQILESKGIKATIISFEDSAYNWIYKLTKGAGKVLVFKEDVKKAKEVIDHYLKEVQIKDNIELREWEKQLYQKLKNLAFTIFICLELFMLFLFYLGLRSILVIRNLYAGIAFIVVSLVFGLLIFLSWKAYKSKIS